MYILPEPKEVRQGEGAFLAESGMRIVSADEVLKASTGWALPGILRDELLKWGGVNAEISAGQAFKGDISLKICKEIAPQSYKLSVTPDIIEIKGGDRAGVGYGIHTLCELIKREGGLISSVDISDAPDMPARGYYMDQARGRIMKLSSLKRMVDTVCRYKINQFQIYIEQSFLFRGFSEMWREDTVITAEEIMELDRYCKDRDVDLVPSIACFGHVYELLKTKSFEKYCELEESAGKPFSFWSKMQHHTVNVSDESSFELMKTMLDEFLPLFSSKFVNICADETFELGKGRSKELADKVGEDRLYVDFLKKLCGYVKDRGKTPMFWGDIICKNPDYIKELPEDTICMSWGYAPDQDGTACKLMAEAGAVQYICPGVCGWNTWMNRLDNAFLNIRTMCGYAMEYKAVGVLNTDWGDFGHVNNPDFSIPAAIYGAVFSWNFAAYSGEPDKVKEELNRKISALEYADTSEAYISLLEEAATKQIFDWWSAVMYYEDRHIEGRYDKNTEPSEFNTHSAVKENLAKFKADIKKVDEAEAALKEIRIKLRKTAASMDTSSRRSIYKVDNAIWAIRLWNRVGKAVLCENLVTEAEKESLAAELELWYMKYKDIYREGSKEGMLHRISRVVFRYADMLRGIENPEWKFHGR